MLKFILGLLVGLVLGLSMEAPAEITNDTTPVSYQSESGPEKAALKLGNKLNCAKQTYTLKERVWTWSCMNKNHQRAYSLVHPDFASDLFFATGNKCKESRQVWFVFAPNNWAIGVKSQHDVGTRALAAEVQKHTGGYADYVCR